MASFGLNFDPLMSNNMVELSFQISLQGNSNLCATKRFGHRWPHEVEREAASGVLYLNPFPWLLDPAAPICCRAALVNTVL